MKTYSTKGKQNPYIVQHGKFITINFSPFPRSMNSEEPLVWGGKGVSWIDRVRDEREPPKLFKTIDDAVAEIELPEDPSDPESMSPVMKSIAFRKQLDRVYGWDDDSLDSDDDNARFGLDVEGPASTHGSTGRARFGND